MTMGLNQTFRRWAAQHARQVLLASMAAGALTAGSVRPAHAQLAVFDGATFGQLVNSAIVGSEQLSQLENVVGLSKQQLNELTTLYTTFAHLTNATQLSSVLLQQSTINALPAMANIENLLRGTGFTGTLASQAQAMLAKIQVYRPPGTDFAATQINSEAAATAGQMTTAETLYNSQTARISGLQTLMTDLGRSGDPKQTADEAARIGIENGYAAAQGNQALALQVMQKAQEDTSREQADQTWRQGADNLLQQAQTAEAAAPGS